MPESIYDIGKNPDCREDGGREKKNKYGKRNKKNKEKEENESMRLRNIPGAKEAIQESKYVVHQPPTSRKAGGSRRLRQISRFI